MTNEEIIYASKFAMETIEDWLLRYPKKAHEDDFKAIEQLEQVIKHLKEEL